MAKNFFDQFDAQDEQTNFFDRFDAPEPAREAPKPAEDQGIIARIAGLFRSDRSASSEPAPNYTDPMGNVVGGAEVPGAASSDGVISRIGKALRPEPRSVMEGYQYTPQQQQADLDRRLSYGAGPISQDTVLKADLVRSGLERSNSPIVNRVAQAMDERGEDTFGDLIARANDPEIIRGARMAKAEEFRTPGEWAIDTLSSLGQGVTSLVELPVNIIAPSGDMARYLRDVQKEWQAQESDVLKAQRENLRERLRTEDGFLNKYIATVQELVTNPAMSLSEAVKQVPMFLGVLGGAKVGAALAGGAVGAASRVSPTLALGEAISGGAIRAGAQAAGSTAGGVAASAVMAGGDAAGSVYERLTDTRQTPLEVWEQNPDYQRLTAEGKSSKEAIEEIATTKARLAAAITAPLGVFGFMGAEAAIASRGLLGAATQVAGPKAAAKTFGKELLGEQVEEGGTQLGANVLTRTVDPRQSLTEGVPEAMGTALVTSTPFAAIGAAGDLRTRQEPVNPYVDQAARTLLSPQTYDPRVVSPEVTVDPAKISSDISRATSTDSAIAAAEMAAGTLNLDLPPVPPPAPASEGLLASAAPDLVTPTGQIPAPPAAPSLPGIDPAVEQQYGFDQLRLQSAAGATTTPAAPAAPAAPAPMNAPRPQRIQGTPVDQLTDEQLEQIAGNDSVPAITRRGASVELAARRSDAAPKTRRVEPTLDIQSLSADPVAGAAPTGQSRVEPTLNLPDASAQPATAAPGATQLDARVQPSATVQPSYAGTTYSFLSIPQQPGVRDLPAAPVGGEAAARSARETAQRSVDAWSESTGQPSPAVFNPASPELDSAVNQIAQAVNSQFAGRIYAYNDNRPEALNGIAIGKVAFVNTANVDVNAARTSLHEFKHTVEQIAAAEERAGQTGTAAQKFVADIDSLYDDMFEAGKRAYLTNFLAKDELAGIADATQREARIQELMADPATRSEMTADFLGNRATDKQFWADVAQADPEGFRGFVQKWMGIIDNLLAQLRGTSTQGRKESAKVDEYVRDLNRAKMVAREALIAYSKATRAPTTEATQTEQAPAFSARQPGGAVPVVRIDPGKKKIDERLPELMAAADRVASGEITPAQYGALANSPQALGSIAPYDFVPAPATDREALSALTENKRAAWNGTNNLQAGERVGLRLDIPAYKDHGVWVNSIHPAGKPTAYSAVSAVTDAVFPDAGSKALGVAQGKAKAPFARIEGRWSPITPDQAVARMQEVFNDPQWTQVGYNPLRHSYFFDRKTGNPVTAAEEVIQIGPLVLAKNATIENAEARNEDGTRKFAFSQREADFTDPEQRVEVSTTRPVPAPKKGRTSNSYTEKWVIDGADVRASAKHVAAVLRALRGYNTLSGKGNPEKLMQELHDVVVENLLWFHDLVPADIRARAKLWYDGANRIATDWTSKYGVSVRQASGVLAVLSPQMDWFKNVSLGERVISIWKNRQNEAWSPAMTAWLDSWVNASKDVDTKASRQAVLEKARPLQGVTLAEMNDRQAALFIRVFDETYHERQYRLVTPEGGFGDYVTNSDDGDASVTWGGFDTIEKAVSILNDGSFRNVEDRLGDEHKVRNFFNNIISPGSADGHVTIDTHAVAAALVKALSGSSREVEDNFGAAGRNAETGASGVYGLFADAYRDAAARRGILPREMQSITWEAVRALFPASIKDQLAPQVDAVWNRFRKGEITRDQAREEVRELAGGIRPMAWEGTDAGKFAADGGASFNAEIPEQVDQRQARTLPPEIAKDKIQVNLSANTSTIPGVAALQAAAARGDMLAHRLLQDIALDNLRHLLAGTSARVKADGVTGLYGGSVESGLSMSVSFADYDRPAVLAALAKFADNFNQEQVHVRRGIKAKVGTQFDDNSYVTHVFRFDLTRGLSRKQIDKVIADSGLPGLTFGDDFVEAYYVGDPSNEEAISKFREGALRARQSLGKNVRAAYIGTARLWTYGDSERGLGFDRVRGDVPAGTGVSSETAKRVAGYLNQVKGKDGKPVLGKVKTFDQPAEITPQQDALQTRAAQAYDVLPENDLKNPNVRKAYAELSKEVLRQFRAMPIKLEVYTGTGEPYANSAAMRRDVLDNNHLFIYATEPGKFGPEGQDFSAHPLLADSGERDVNGYKLVFNDLLRGVHDYYAHAMSPAQFGPKGEEAAWKNHMSMTPNMWARWALTMETRAQNSWVNFREGLDRSTPISQRSFAPQKAALLPIEFTLTGDRTVDKPMKEFIAKLGDKVRQGSKPVAKPAMSQRQTDNPDIRRSSRQRNALGLYSALAEGIDGIKTNAAPAAGWRDAIKGLVNKGQVKADEVEWSGVNDWLALQQGRVTKDAVVEYLRGNGVQIEETVLGDLKDFSALSNEQLRKEYVRIRGFEPEAYGEPMTRDEILDELDGAMDDDLDDTRYGKYTLPGGKNYREVLLTLPLTTRNAEGLAEAERLNKKADELDRQAMAAWTERGDQAEFSRLNEQARDLRRRATAAEKAGGTESYKYKSAHWDQPNVLAHLRVNDRTDADGSRVLFVEELQSDWQQARGSLERKLKKAKTDEDRIGLQRRIDALPKGPFVGSTEAWLNLALKRVLTMAVEGGYDKVALTTGAQSAQRYSLETQVSSIRTKWSDSQRGERKVDIVTKEPMNVIGLIVDKSGTVIGSMTNGMNGKTLDEIIGKEMAQKVMENEGDGKWSGLDLKVGGEGMIAFYDKIVPNAVRALAKKLGGRVEMVKIINQESDFDLDEIGNATPEELRQLEEGGVMLRQPGLVITDEMRAKVGEGLPMFSRRQDVAAAEEALDLVRKARAYEPMEGEERIVFPILYHSGTGDPDALAKGVEPQFGSWVAEVLDGAYDGETEIDPDESFVPLSYYASAPEWVRIQTARNLGKQYNEVTLDDIRNRGQLAIVYNVDEDFGEAKNEVFQIGPDGYNGGYTEVIDVYGKKRKLYETGLEEEGDFRSGPKQLFGVEPGDIVTNQSIEPDVVLTGDALVEFMRRYQAEVDPSIKFSRRQTETPEFKAWFKNSKVVNGLGQARVVYHGTADDVAIFDMGRAGQTYGLKDEQAFFFTGRIPTAESAADDATGLPAYRRKYINEGFGGGMDRGDSYDGYDDGDSYDYTADYNGGQNIVPVYLSLQNPLIIDAESGYGAGAQLELRNSESPGELIARAKADGHDGIIIRGKYRNYESIARINANNWLNGQEKKKYLDRIAREDARKQQTDHYFIAFRPDQIKSAIGNIGAFGQRQITDEEANRLGMGGAEAQYRQYEGDIRFSRRQRQADSWNPLRSRDEVGRRNFGPGAKAYDIVANLANNVLDRVGMKPVSEELGRAMRNMKVEVERAQNKVAMTAKELEQIPQDEREMISDVIEGELRAGIHPPQHVLQVAASMQSIMSEQSRELVRLGMLSQEAANRWDQKYLPRFYESKLGDEVTAWAKAAKALFGRQPMMQGIRGSSLKARGMFETVDVADLPQWLAQGWEQRDPNFNPATSTETVVWRDYSRQEREDMGEIRDAMFRFVMGYNRTQRDVALGRLYESLAQNYASAGPQDGYVLVPDTKVEGTMAARYGKLAGKYVPKEVMDHLSVNDETMMEGLFKIYKAGLSKWKEGKTVLNPVSHANNVISNVTMAHFAGVSYWDVQKYAGAVKDLVTKDPMVAEAKDIGLFGGTFSQSEIVASLPPQLRAMAGMSESKLAKLGNGLWDILAYTVSWNNKKYGARPVMQWAYENEDLFFRYVVYRDARNRGMDAEDAREYAQQFLFVYDDLPKNARMVRDIGLPFFSYTYKVVPVLARTALEYPWRYAAPAMAAYAANAMMYAMAASLGGDDDDWWGKVLYKWATDEKFRKRAQALEEEERKNLPDWMKGGSAMLGTPKAVRLGINDVTGLPMFLDISRIFPGGDLLDAQNNAGGVALLQPLTPSNPVLTTAVAMLANKDMFFGKEVVKASDTEAEKTQKRAAWLWKQVSPAIAVGNYHFDRGMNVLANVSGKPITVDAGPLGVIDYTGVGRDGLPVQPKLAALQTVGVKVRPYDLDTAEAMNKAAQEKLVREITIEIKRINRLESKGAISEEAADVMRERQYEKRSRLREGLTVDGEKRR